MHLLVVTTSKMVVEFSLLLFEYLFSSHRNCKGHANSQSANMALKRIGFEPDMLEAALAHIDHNEVRRAYNRAEYLQQRRVMMLWWSEHIEKAANGNMSLSSGFKGLRVVGE